MILVRSKKKLKKLLRDIPQHISSWERLGPCPDFISTPGVVFSVKGKEYVVLTDIKRFMELLGEQLSSD